ncbi:helix-hairpin-helix domain-containing protein, partial [Streptococcus pyogenes]
MIAALGIPLVGTNTAKIIASEIEHIGQFNDLTQARLQEMEGVGPSTAQAVLAYIQSPAGSQEVMNIHALGLELKPSAKLASDLP